jgi:hypothetical protein
MVVSREQWMGVYISVAEGKVENNPVLAIGPCTWRYVRDSRIGTNSDHFISAPRGPDHSWFFLPIVMDQSTSAPRFRSHIGASVELGLVPPALHYILYIQ